MFQEYGTMKLKNTLQELQLRVQYVLKVSVADEIVKNNKHKSFSIFSFRIGEIIKLCLNYYCKCNKYKDRF